MVDEELAYAGALEQARLIREGEVSPVELAQLYLDRIERHDPALNAFITVAAEQGLEAARKAEQAVTNADDRSGLPAFHGVPIAIKDLNDTAGIRTTYGMVTFEDHVPVADDHSVSRLKDAGFVVIGKTNTPEQGIGCVTEPPAYGPARNPWGTSRTPGGSSGGAAAALAAGLIPVAHGSDGGGSVRIPSAWCGLVGVKPSRGRILRKPGDEGVHATVGPLAWSVADAAATLDAMRGPAITNDLWGLPPGEPFLDRVGEEPGRLRIAVSDGDLDLAPGNRAGLERAAALLEELGHDVEEASPGPRWPEVHYERIIGDPELLRVMSAGLQAAERGEPPVEFLHPAARYLLEHGPGDAVEYLLTKQKVATIIARWVAEGLALFEDFDVLVTPTVATPPLEVGLHERMEPADLWRTMYEACPFTTLFNMTGQPAVSLPLHEDEDGLPVGIQLVFRPTDEDTLFRLASQIEQARPWHHRRPPGY